MPPASAQTASHVQCHLEHLLQERQMTLTELSERVGVSIVNLSIMKNNKAKAVRFTTLVAICAALECEIGDVFTVATG